MVKVEIHQHVSENCETTSETTIWLLSYWDEKPADADAIDLL